jgi:hypothetical protein
MVSLFIQLQKHHNETVPFNVHICIKLLFLEQFVVPVMGKLVLLVYLTFSLVCRKIF